jgi:hypothetical protein
VEEAQQGDERRVRSGQHRRRCDFAARYRRAAAEGSGARATGSESAPTPERSSQFSMQHSAASPASLHASPTPTPPHTTHTKRTHATHAPSPAAQPPLHPLPHLLGPGAALVLSWSSRRAVRGCPSTASTCPGSFTSRCSWMGRCPGCASADVRLFVRMQGRVRRRQGKNPWFPCVP